jgi:RHS repeat-associated protein
VTTFIPGLAPNYGVILWATNEDVAGYTMRFYSSEATNSSDRPYLEVVWSNTPKTVYFLKDHLGSIRATVLDSATAPVIGYDDYDPWGYPLAQRTKAIPNAYLQGASKYKFTRKERDDDLGLNLDYFGARYYDWLRGQWISRDPLAQKYPSWSPYVYGLNNPIRFFDDDGRDVRNATPSGSVMRMLLVSAIIKNLTTWKSRDAKDYNAFLEHVRGKSLGQVTHEADRFDKTNYSAGGPFDEFKFIKDPAAPNRIIDMRHFIVIGQLGQGTLGLLKANAYGILVELGQIAKGNIESGANLEDFYSNYLGSIFFHYYYDATSTKTFEQQLREWLEQRKKEQEEKKKEEEAKKKEEEEKKQN